MKSVYVLVVALFAANAITTADACVDNNDAIATLSSQQGDGSISACIDLDPAICAKSDKRGQMAREYCCQTCLGQNNDDPPTTSTNPDDGTCVDNNEAIANLSNQHGDGSVSGCIDLDPGACVKDNKQGQIAREYCCQTCLEPNEPIENDLPTGTDVVDLFLLSGQSECSGAGQVSDLNIDSSGNYPNLQGVIDGVWFAGYRYQKRPENFFIRPMLAGEEKTTFGPELSFGERYHNVTGRRTMVVKYCNGGTNVFEDWNPETPANSWDKQADDGTSQWMAANAGLNFSSKAHLFKNMIWTIRKTEETLKEGGVPFRWAGIIWVQGVGDRQFGGDPLWKTFGENTARVWEGFRDGFNQDYVDGTVPIIDNGSSGDNDLHSGKVYATQIVKGCKAINVEKGLGGDDESFDCNAGAANPCLDAPNKHTNWDLFNFYGYDPLFPDDLKPVGFTDKIFRWWANFPTDMHSGYEGMIQNGQMFANQFIREYTTSTLPEEYASVDPAIQFPWNPCVDGSLPSGDNICWIDKRDPALFGDLCVEEAGGNLSNQDDDLDDSSAPASIQGSMSFLSGVIILFLSSVLL